MSHRRRGPRAILLLVLALTTVLVPPVLGQGSTQGGAGGSASAAHEPQVRGYTAYGPVSFWGSVEPLPTRGFHVQDLTTGHRLLAWIGTANGSQDVFVFDLRGRVLHRVTHDGALQAHPAVDGTRVVWEERTGSGDRIRAYDLTNDTVWTVASHGFHMTRPAIAWPYVAWSDRRNGTWNVHVVDLRSGHERQVSDSTFVATDPVFAGRYLAWRQEDYGEWDIFVHDMTTGRTSAVTRDTRQEDQLASDGTTFTFRRPGSQGVGDVFRYDPRTGDLHDTGLVATYGSTLTLDGPDYVTFVRYASGSSIVVGNLSNGASSGLTLGPANFTDTLGLRDGTVLAVLKEGNATHLLAVHVSPLALAPPPQVVIASPHAGQTLVNRTTVAGRVTAVDRWGSPTDVLVRLDAGPWLPVRGTDRWSVPLDLSDLVPGSHTIQVAASFDAGPPQASRVDVVVLSGSSYAQDLRPYLQAQHVGLLSAILGNGLLLLLTLLVLATLALVAVRAYLRWLADRPDEVTYVPPEDPGPSPVRERWVPPPASEDEA